MRAVENDSEIVCFGDELLPERAQSGPALALGIGRRVRQLVVGEMHWPRHTDAELVEASQQRHIGAERPGVLDALKNNAFALTGNFCSVRRFEGERKMRAVAGNHLADL